MQFMEPLKSRFSLRFPAESKFFEENKFQTCLAGKKM